MNGAGFVDSQWEVFFTKFNWKDLSVKCLIALNLDFNWNATGQSEFLLQLLVWL